MKRITLILVLIVSVFSAFAQTDRPVMTPRGKTGLGALDPSGGYGGVIGASDPKMRDKSDNYTDEGLEELNERMKEREWGSEDTAWGRACELNSKESYEKYMAMYPQGAHIGEATCRLIDAKVAQMLRDAHEELPNIERTEADDDSPKSTLHIKNNTGYPLTVYLSGDNSKKVVILPDGTVDVTVDNGLYKLGASVPPSHIRPYAGQTTLRGGRYEIGFWVVTR